MSTKARVHPKKIRVSVSQEDIDKGTRLSSLFCPITRALRDDLCEDRYIEVGAQTALIGTALIGFVRYNLSTRAKRFISKFDKDLPVEPSTFILTRTE